MDEAKKQATKRIIESFCVMVSEETGQNHHPHEMPRFNCLVAAIVEELYPEKNESGDVFIHREGHNK